MSSQSTDSVGHFMNKSPSGMHLRTVKPISPVLGTTARNKVTLDKAHRKGVKRLRQSPVNSASSTQACYIPLDNLLSLSTPVTDPLKRELSQMRKQLLETKAKVDALENLYSPLLPLIPLLIDKPIEDDKALHKAAHLIDILSTEIGQRLLCHKQIVIYNVPDKIPAIKAAKAALNACNINDDLGRCVRLRKTSPSACCPLLLEFDNVSTPKKISANYKNLISHPYFRNAKVSPARTRIQRELSTVTIKGMRDAAAEVSATTQPKPSSVGSSPVVNKTRSNKTAILSANEFRVDEIIVQETGTCKVTCASHPTSEPSHTVDLDETITHSTQSTQHCEDLNTKRGSAQAKKPKHSALSASRNQQKRKPTQNDSKSLPMSKLPTTGNLMKPFVKPTTLKALLGNPPRLETLNFKPDPKAASRFNKRQRTVSYGHFMRPTLAPRLITSDLQTMNNYYTPPFVQPQMASHGGTSNFHRYNHRSLSKPLPFRHMPAHGYPPPTIPFLSTQPPRPPEFNSLTSAALTLFTSLLPFLTLPLSTQARGF